MAGSPVASITALALIRAFASKVVPVSSGSRSTPTSRWERTSTPIWERMARISVIFLAL
ncbi:unknown [Firmicutes bacterium CAG:114]|nr:unknown [Firmicutes bacterium CAG:114]